jgi:hypothetical protein
MYDSMSPAQKRLTCDLAKKIYRACQGRTGRAADHNDAAGRLGAYLSIGIVAVATTLADAVAEGRITLESLDTP